MIIMIGFRYDGHGCWIRQVHNEMKYMPYGEMRLVNGQSPTDTGYTGHYDSSLRHFLEADAIVPGMGIAMAFDRYMYVFGNPIIMVDPSGNVPCFEDGYCVYGNYSQEDHLSYLQKRYDIGFSGNWSSDDMWSILEAVHTVASRFGNYDLDLSSLIFKTVFRGLTFTRVNINAGYWGEYASGNINIYSGAGEWGKLIPHELGHAFNGRLADKTNHTPYNILYKNGISTADGTQIAGYRRGYTVPGTGYTCGDGSSACLDDDAKPIPANHYYRTFVGLSVNQSPRHLPGEDFADMFASWATYGFPDDTFGHAREQWISTNMPIWLSAGGR